MSTSQPPKCYLLRIPRELRDAIYAYYLSDDGYYHQPESNTLRHADRSAIDLALTLSCKQVAAEMIALPLKLNAVEFRTHLAPIETAGIGERKWLFRKPPPRDRHNDDYSAPPSRAGHFHFLLARLHDKEADACVIAFNAYGTEELAKCISERFPQSCLGKQLHKLLPNKVTEASYYEVMDRFRNSTFYERQAMQFLLENISAFATQANIVNESNHKSENEFKLPLGPMSRHASEVVASRISSVEWPPWVLPTALHISKLHEIVNSVDKSDPEHGYCSNAHKLRYYESAASQCIRFLGMLEQDASFRLRHLIIREDRRSCTKPRCHAYGLIPYLRGLPHLRVDHHVDMWHVIFTTDYSGLARLGLDLRSWPDPRFIPWLSNAVDETATWIKEAMHLRRAGMPPSAYRLHLEAPVETVEDVWGIIKSRAALHHLTSHLPVRNKYRSFRCDDDFVSCVRLILRGDSTVHLPCPIGTLEEFEEEIGRISEDLNSLPRNLWEDYGIDLVERALDTSMVDVKAIYELYTDSPA